LYRCVSPFTKQDRLAEAQDEVAQGVAEFCEPVALAPDFPLEVRVPLREDQHPREVARAREREAVVQPREHRGHARAVLGVHRRGASEVVVAALDVEADEQDSARDPAQVLAVLWKMSRVVLRLALEPDPGFAEAGVPRLEQLAESLEALHRIASAAVAIHPFVVSGDDDEGMPRSLELAFARLEPRVAARTLASRNVPDVDHEREVSAFIWPIIASSRGGLAFVVGRIADQRERERGAERRRQRRRMCAVQPASARSSAKPKRARKGRRAADPCTRRG